MLSSLKVCREFFRSCEEALCGELGGRIGSVLQLVTCCVAEEVFGKKGGMRSETGIVGTMRTGLGDRGVG